MAVTNEQVSAYLAANPGMSDEQIASAMTQYGVTPEQMAQVTGIDQGAVQSRYNAAKQNTGALSQANQSQPTVVGGGALAQTAFGLAEPNYDQMVKDAYGSIGRTGFGTEVSNIDQAGYDYWLNALQTGQSTPEAFQRNFQTAVSDYLTKNPLDPYSKYVSEFLGSNKPTPAQVANTPGVGTAGIGIATPTAFDVKDEVSETFKSVYGRYPTANELKALRDAYGMSLESGELQKIVLGNRDYVTGYHQNPYQPTIQSVVPEYQVVTNEFGEDVQKIVGYKDAITGEPVDPSLVKYDSNEEFTGYYIPLTPLDYSGGVLGNLTNQILASSDPTRWSGEGYGSAQKNAADMATLLASIGITDIKQLGVRQVERPGEPIYFDDNGQATAFSDPTLVNEYYNKETGEVLDPRYAKAQGNIFSGTFAGEGSTGYGVQFREDGSPVFYTQYMGSSNDLAQLLSDPLIGGIVQAAASYFGGPIGSAALNLLAGREVEDVAKAALTSYVANQVGSYVSSSESVVDALGKTGANIAGNVAGTVATGGGEEGALQALLTGGVNLAMPEITNLIPGYGELTSGQREFVNSAIASTLKDGNLTPAELIRAAVSAGKAASQSTGGITNRITDDMTGTAADAFVAAKRTGASDADAMAASNALTQIAEANETFDGSGFASQKEAMDAAIAEGLDKFTFGGKRFTIDNSAAQIADFEQSVRNEMNARAASTTEWGDLAGAQAAATARNTVAIGNAEANDANEAAYLAKLRDPTATNFTFDGKTYTMSASSSEMARANRDATLAEIKDLPNFNEAYARARSVLGPNQTFEWNGKQYSTATAQERPDLSGPSIETLNARNLATTTDASKTVAAQTDMAARDAAAIETANQISRAAATKPVEQTSFFGQLYKDLNDRFRMQGEAANEYLRNNPNSPITASVSSAFEAAGELSRNIGGAALALDNKPLADAIIQGGSRLQKMGQSIGDGPEDTKNWNDTLALIDKAKGTEKLAVLAGRIMDGKSGLARQVGLELRQEIPALFLGGGLLRPTMIASGLIDTADTGGAAVIDAYDDVIKRGGTHQEGLTAGRKAGAAAAATEAAIQLTLGKIADVAAGKLDNVISKGSAKVAGEGVVEGSQEAGASAAVDLALGNAIDVNKALTQGVIGAAVGKGTAASTTPIDAAQTAPTATEVGADTAAASTGTAIDLGPIGTTVPGESVLQSTDLGTIGNVTPGADVAATQTPVTVEEAQQVMADLGLNVSDDVAVSLASKIQNTFDSTGTVETAVSSAPNIANAITTQIKSGSDASVAIGDTVTSAITSGGDTASVVNTAVTSAVTSGGNASTAVGSAVTAAVNSGGNVSAAIDSAVTAAVETGANVDTSIAAAVSSAVNAGTNISTVIDAATNAATATNNNVNIVSDANTVTISNATTNTQTTVDTKTGITTSVDNNTNTTTVVDGNTTTVVDNNANITSQTVVDGNTQTTVTSDANTNTNTQTVVDTNTNTTTSTTVNTNTNTTTQTTINTNTNTQTTVVTDTNTNTQTTVTINTNTGEPTEIIETEIPTDWKPPVIEPPVVPDAPSIPASATPSTSVNSGSSRSLSLQMGDDAFISGGLGPPTGIDIYGDPLGSRVTQGRIDPLARVKEAQAELERDLMMNQLDPRFVNVIQQRMDPQQLTNQFDKDIGALEKLLRGEPRPASAPSAPANENKYYSYGSEDSIDDILGGKAANYAAGGYVEPLKASGGSMALPLLAKSGGALDKYHGRENFKEGKHVAGEGDGQSDDIPAWLADGEFVFPADVVSALGNGSTKAGTDKLYEMMHNIRERARSKGPKDLPPPAFKSPLDYLKSSKRSK